MGCSVNLCCCGHFISATTLCSVFTCVCACCSARDAGVDAQRLEAMAPDAKRPKMGTEDTGGKKKT